MEFIEFLWFIAFIVYLLWCVCPIDMPRVDNNIKLYDRDYINSLGRYKGRRRSF